MTNIFYNAYKRCGYSGKIMMSAYFITAMLIVASTIIVIFQFEAWHFGTASPASLQLLVTVMLPLATILLAAGLFAEEFSGQLFALIWTYPFTPGRLLLERLSLLLMLMVLQLALAIVSIYWSPAQLSLQQLWEIAYLAWPTHLFLAGLSLMCSLLGRGALAGLAGGLIFWLAETITKGTWTKALFLFQPVWPRDQVATSDNRLLLISGAVACFVLAYGIFQLGRRYLIGKEEGN
ncbi:hypothetical protein EBB07_27655 [Paenibacillaceae bacterium]|nr:hypothetical protein EBB07_27655 [Paenibacillaceae bacterium]